MSLFADAITYIVTFAHKLILLFIVLDGKFAVKTGGIGIFVLIRRQLAI